MAQAKEGAEPEALAVDLCLRCARPLNPLQSFCPHCGAPAGYAASLPFELKLVLAQSIGMMFRRACLTPGVQLRRWALDVLVLTPWVAYFALLVPAEISIRVHVRPATVAISLLLAASGLLWYRLRRCRDSGSESVTEA